MKNKSTVAGMVLAGLATGAAAWYLFGTDKGKDVCNRLMGSMRNLSDTVSEKATDTLNHLTGKSENVANTAMG